MIILKNEINIAFPQVPYENLKEKLTMFIKNEVDNFLDFAKEKYQMELPCNLTITYEYYSYNGYDSYVFYISSFVFGAHPDNRIVSFTYDTINNKLITIADLMKKDPFILNYLSKETRSKLLNNKRIVDRNMLLEGTKPVIDNYQVFAFTPRGILLFFPQYQIAPYSSGSFKVLIPYRNSDFLDRSIIPFNN